MRVRTATPHSYPPFTNPKRNPKRNHSMYVTLKGNKYIQAGQIRLRLRGLLPAVRDKIQPTTHP